MNVLFVTPEFFPLASSGGLAEISASLPNALNKLGINCQVLMPAYPDAVKQLKRYKVFKLGDLFDWGHISLIKSKVNGTVLWLVHTNLFKKKGSYYKDAYGNDYVDNYMRFACFARVAASFAILGYRLGFKVDLMHLNDWQSGLTSAYLKQMGLYHIPTLLTIHNLMYRGLFGLELFHKLALSESYTEPIEYWGHLCYLKIGIELSDHINTVSPNYAREIMTEKYAQGFEGLIKSNSYKLSGILNGIDTLRWNPSLDNFLPQKYNSQTHTEGKKKAKKLIQEKFDLEVNENMPIYAYIGRLSEQKGVDLILKQIDEITNNNGQLIILGVGDTKWEELFVNLNKNSMRKIKILLEFDEQKAHEIYAGGDFLLLPSRFEPCGLAQIYAMQYGMVPIANATGGILDTVHDANNPQATGILMFQLDDDNFRFALERSRELYNNKTELYKIRQNGMSRDFSWDKSAKEYVELYEDLLSFKHL